MTSQSGSGGAGAPTLSTLSAALAADTPSGASSAWLSVVTLALTPGTWLLIGKAQMLCGAAAQGMGARLFNVTGAAELDFGLMTQSATWSVCIPLLATIVVTGATTIALQATSGGTAVTVQANPAPATGTHDATRIQAIQVG